MSDPAQAVENAQGGEPAAAAAPKTAADRFKATLAALEANEHESMPVAADETAPPAKKPAKPAEPADDEDDDDLADADEDEDEDLDDEGDDDLDEDEDDDTDDEDDAEPDPSLDHKALSKVKQAERRAKQLEKRAQATLVEAKRIEASVAERVAKADRFEKLIARIPYEGLAPLLDLIAPDLDDDALETAARELYTRSSKGAKDAAGKAAVAERQRLREMRDEIAALKKAREEDAAARERLAAQDAGAREGRAYLSKVVKRSVVGDETPLAAKALAKGAKGRRESLAEVAAIAARLAERTGDVPSPRKVLRTYEARLRTLRGDTDLPAAATSAAGGKKNRTQEAGENRTAPPSNGQKPKDARARRADTLARLEAGQLD